MRIDITQPLELDDGTPVELEDYWYEEDKDGDENEDPENGYIAVIFDGSGYRDGSFPGSNSCVYAMIDGIMDGGTAHDQKLLRNVQAIDPRDFIEDLI